MGLPRRLRDVGRLFASAGVLSVALSCASTSPFVERQAPGSERRPWALPAAELGTQRLFRVRLQSPERRGRFRLLLRLESEDRYRIESTHPLFSRRLWSFSSERGHGLLVDYLQKVACRYEGEIEIAALPLGPFDQDRLPALLLGYPPLVTDQSPSAAIGDTKVVDRSGRRWTLRSGPQGVEHWILWDELGRRAEWRLEEEWAVLEARNEEIRVRWRETVREPIRKPLQPLEIPAGFDRGDCDLGWMEGVEGTWETSGDAENFGSGVEKERELGR